jgi:hypothetical protein
MEEMFAKWSARAQFESIADLHDQCCAFYARIEHVVNMQP